MSEPAAKSSEHDVIGSRPAGTGYSRGTPGEPGAPGTGPGDPKLSESFRMLEERGAPAEGEGWREIDRAVLAHLRRNPSDAVSVLSYANQSGLIDSLSYEFPAAESGLGFRCEAALIDHQDPGPHR
jgi:hypothetical protein